MQLSQIWFPEGSELNVCFFAFPNLNAPQVKHIWLPWAVFSFLESNGSCHRDLGCTVRRFDDPIYIIAGLRYMSSCMIFSGPLWNWSLFVKKNKKKQDNLKITRQRRDEITDGRFVMRSRSQFLLSFFLYTINFLNVLHYTRTHLTFWTMNMNINAKSPNLLAETTAIVG
jgi:hypothetical protein